MENINYFTIQISFVVLTVVFVGWFLKEIITGIKLSSIPSKEKLRTRIIAGIVLWFGLVSALSLSGFLQNFSALPPRLLILLVIPLISILIITFSSTLLKILKHIPARNLARLQVFRVFVEILLWMLFIKNLLPKQMTMEGRNFDILSGLSAPIIAYFFNKNRTVMIVWNFIGLALLLNILTIAILSMPTPFRVFMNDPSNTIVAYFPIVLLPSFLVPLAYTLHFFSLRQLMAEKN